jgi:5'-phosphate synthase pdxT subunit
MDIDAERNAFGRPLHSFEENLEFPDLPGGPVRAVFIRAPWITSYGPEVQVLAAVDGHPVAARQGRLLAISFHPELGDDDRLHRAFLEQVRAARNGA